MQATAAGDRSLAWPQPGEQTGERDLKSLQISMLLSVSKVVIRLRRIEGSNPVGCANSVSPAKSDDERVLAGMRLGSAPPRLPPHEGAGRRPGQDADAVTQSEDMTNTGRARASTRLSHAPGRNLFRCARNSGD